MYFEHIYKIYNIIRVLYRAAAQYIKCDFFLYFYHNIK